MKTLTEFLQETMDTLERFKSQEQYKLIKDDISKRITNLKDIQVQIRMFGLDGQAHGHVAARWID